MKNATILMTLGALFAIMDTRANVDIFIEKPDGKQELLRSNKLFMILADNEFIGNLSIYNARVIGLSNALGVTSILIEEA